MVEIILFICYNKNKVIRLYFGSIGSRIKMKIHERKRLKTIAASGDKSVRGDCAPLTTMRTMVTAVK